MTQVLALYYSFYLQFIGIGSKAGLVEESLVDDIPVQTIPELLQKLNLAVNTIVM